MSALGRLVASVAMDTAEFTVGTDKAKYLAAQMAGEVDRTLKGLENSVKGTMGSIAAGLAAGFGIAALKSAFDSYTEGAAKLQDLAAKAGLTVEKMSGFVSVAKLSGTSADDLAGAFEKLSRGMVNATGDTAGAGRALAFLGISATDSSGRLKDAGTLTEEVAAKLAGMRDGAGKTAIAMDLYGKSGANLIPVLKDINEFGVKNATITAQQAAIAKEYEQDLVRLGMAKSALVKIISSELLPVGDAVVKTFLQMQTQAGGVRDKTQELANDGSIRAFAMSAVNAFGLVFNAGDSVIRIFEAAGEQIAYLVARTGNALSTIGNAVLNFIQGNYKQAWNDVKTGAVQDAAIVIDHGNAMRAVFEKPLAGDKFVAGVESSLASIDQKMKQHGDTVRNTGDGYKKLATDTTAADDATKAILKSITDLIKAMDQLASIGNDYAISLAAQIQQHQFDLTLIGKSADEVQRLTEMRKLDLDLVKEAAKISSQDDSDTSAAQGEQLDKMIRLNEVAKARIGIIFDTGAAMRQQQADFQAEVKEMDSAGDAVGRFFGSFVTSGKSAIQIVRDELKKLLADLVALAAKKIFLNIVANGTTGSISSAAGQAAASAGSNSIAGSVLNWAGTATGATGALSGLSAGFASGLGEAAAGDAFVGASATLAGGAVGVGAELGTAYAALMGTLAAIPIWGWIAAAVIAVAAWLGGKGGGPKTGGSFMGAFDANGLIQNIAVPGTENGRFFTPSQGDDTLKQLVGATDKSYRGTAAALGLNARNFTFGLGFDNDPNGTAQSRVSSALLDSQGRTIYSQRDMNMDDKAVPAALQLESSRMILAALKASDLPAYLSKVFDGLTPSSATQDQINNAMTQALALKNIFDVVSRNPMKDVSDAMTASQNQLSAAMKTNETQIRAVMKAYDGTLATTQQLQQATVGYYNAQLQLIAGIAQVKQGIDDMFGNTIRNFKLAGLDGQGKYDFYKNEAAELQRQALGSSDPATIQALSQRINDDLNAAFNLLTPEQQAGAEGQSFISGAGATQAALDARLEKIQKDAIDATQVILNEIKDLIGANTDSQTAAANTQLDAANTNLTAANTPRTLIVQTDGGGQEVVTLG